MKHLRALFCLILAILVVIPAAATTYVVNPEGTGDFPTIQTAIDAASNGDTIELTDGTFTGNGNRDIDYLGKAITVRSQSGDPTGCVINCQGSGSFERRGFHFHSGEDGGSVLEGVTVTNGHILNGGGVRCDASSPSLRACVFDANSTSFGGRGGGVYCQMSANPMLDNCIFTANTASLGGGLCTDLSSPSMLDCHFSGNTASRGGGVTCWESSSPSFQGCTFYDNHAYGLGGGGMTIGGSSSAVLTSCLFIYNSARKGGGMSCSSASTFTLITCSFYDNVADIEGGGISHFSSGSPNLSECLFSENRAPRGGGVHCSYSPAPVLEGCTFNGNGASSGSGGGIWFWGAQPTLTDCTFFGEQGQSAGAVFCGNGSHLILRMTIIAFCVEGTAISCDDGSEAT